MYIQTIKFYISQKYLGSSFLLLFNLCDTKNKQN